MPCRLGIDREPEIQSGLSLFLAKISRRVTCSMALQTAQEVFLEMLGAFWQPVGVQMLHGGAPVSSKGAGTTLPGIVQLFFIFAGRLHAPPRAQPLQQQK